MLKNNLKADKKTKKIRKFKKNGQFGSGKSVIQST